MSERLAGRDLAYLIAELQEKEAIKLARELIAEGVEPLAILDLCLRGMTRVGEYYEQKRYFISGLIMAGQIMFQIGQLVLPVLEEKATKGDSGRILIGTVEGDIHFLGKDIFKVLVSAHGFTVHDLGVDVPPGNFLEALREFKPDIVGFSCLISAAYSALENTVALLREQVPKRISPRAYIIGGRVDEVICRNIGEVYWINDAMAGVRLCQKIMNNGKKRKIRTTISKGALQ